MAKKRKSDSAKESYNDEYTKKGNDLKSHFLALVDSILEYFQTLLLYGQKLLTKRLQTGIQAYIFLKIGLFFFAFGSVGFLGALFVFLHKISGGDFLLSSLGAGGASFFLSILFLWLAASFLKIKDRS
ncbi:LBF_4227 family protein [Leptospira borgpetersenii]|uniref:Phage holin family protein n=2 Tax=Leptospira borgpetersenii serovar Hardjo-bovis TaxID=338217 RepID=Q04N93_LEPBJ|nr:hypothetical protein [Leptospira borgpetersenii]ABJ77627.1 Hypothetical protein LBJ_4249 [Leptospira borgpetersenii serovar Hardjo-bovis str. JB197]ABJ80572.1 Hypothetical protein LBL_4263 [Leptospira borgpetersenii serovar Hardjo-bovis str. L550]AMX60019.1 hypothetical protein LBK6_17415 [Leptospira borgpetersenii serovar Hardjo]AMX63249.1 hypothetical protein LBK9_17355 [Leptospira borgpetersenii serovar Hardjo]AMX66493.1 hypothetical protein LBK30_17345 [Leptospira borgpetersenii serovar